VAAAGRRRGPHPLPRRPRLPGRRRADGPVPRPAGPGDGGGPRRVRQHRRLDRGPGRWRPRLGRRRRAPAGRSDRHHLGADLEPGLPGRRRAPAGGGGPAPLLHAGRHAVDPDAGRRPADVPGRRPLVPGRRAARHLRGGHPGRPGVHAGLHRPGCGRRRRQHGRPAPRHVGGLPDRSPPSDGPRHRRPAAPDGADRRGAGHRGAHQGGAGRAGDRRGGHLRACSA